MGLIEAFRKKPGKSDLSEAARKDIRYLLQLSLGSLLAAGRMAEDSRLPEPLSAFAREITKIDDGVPLRPGLRKLVRSWLEDRKSAEEWLGYLERNTRDVDPYLRSFLYPLLKTLLGRNGSARAKEATAEDAPSGYH